MLDQGSLVIQLSRKPRPEDRKLISGVIKTKFKLGGSIKGDKFAAIPEAALLWGANGAYIWLAEDGKAKRVDVSVHQRLRGTILVSGDIEEGDTLISEGVQRLRTGQAITTELAGGLSNE